MVVVDAADVKVFVVVVVVVVVVAAVHANGEVVLVFAAVVVEA